MIQDEFNKVEITNDKQLLKVEFGKTQSSETTSKKENTVPEGDLNEKYVGKTIKKVADINVDYVNKVPTHASQTVVTGSATASTAAAATASTVVAASTVAVVAIATATGISVALHDYKYEFQSLIISSNQLTYQLVVYDAMVSEEEYYMSFEDQEPSYEEEYDEYSSAPFKLRVYNQKYEATQYIWGYSPNYGSFDHLTLGDTYNIVLSENRYGGEEIYKDTFTTFINSAITSFDMYGWVNDYSNGEFSYDLELIDDDNSIDSIILEFYDPELPEEVLFSAPISKATGYQSGNAMDGDYPAFELDRQYGYRLTYYRGNDRFVFKEDTISFYGNGSTPEYRDFIFDKTADFVENTIDVMIDYEDDYDWYSDFKLTLTQIPSEMIDDEGNITNTEEEFYTADINLEPVNYTQTVQLNEYEIFAKEDYFKYTYRLSCLFKGVEQTLEEETVPFSFSDSQGRYTEFNAFLFDKTADFREKTFDVQLDYHDDFGYYDDFCLHLLPNGVNAQYDFALENTSEVQTCRIDSTQHYDFSFDYEFSYYVTCTYQGYEEEIDRLDELFSFVDPNAGSEVYGLIFVDGEANFETRTFKVKLDYRDDFDALSDFVLTIYDSKNGGTTTRPLTKTGDIQDITIDEMESGPSGYIYPVDIVNGELTYNLSYVDSRVSEDAINLFDQNKELVFNNSLKHYFNKVDTSYDFYTVGSENRLAFSFDALNDASVYNNIQLVIEQNGNKLGEISFANEVLRPEVQYGVFTSEDNTVEDLIGNTVEFTVYCTLRDERTDEYTENYPLWSNTEAEFTLNQNTEIYGVQLSDYVTYGDWEASMGIIFSGSSEVYDSVELNLKSSTDGTLYTYEVDIAEFTGVNLLYPTTGSFEESELEQLLEDNDFEIYISYYLLVEDPSDPTGATLIPDGPYSVSCYESFHIMVSH